MNSLYERGKANNDFLSIMADRLRDFRMKLVGNKQPPHAPANATASESGPLSFEQMMHRQYDQRETALADLEREMILMEDFFHETQSTAGKY